LTEGPLFILKYVRSQDQKTHSSLLDIRKFEGVRRARFAEVSVSVILNAGARVKHICDPSNIRDC